MSKTDAENISQYWRTYFEKHPEQLRVRKNDEPIKHWLSEHSGHNKVPGNVMNGLTNQKSLLRKEKGIKMRKRRGRPPKQAATLNAATTTPRAARAPAKLLEALEDQLDKCILLTSGQNHEALTKVVHYLKQARRAVIHQMAE